MNLCSSEEQLVESESFLASHCEMTQQLARRVSHRNPRAMETYGVETLDDLTADARDGSHAIGSEAQTSADSSSSGSWIRVRFVYFDSYGERDVREVLLESQVSRQTTNTSTNDDDLHVRVIVDSEL